MPVKAEAAFWVVAGVGTMADGIATGLVCAAAKLAAEIIRAQKPMPLRFNSLCLISVHFVTICISLATAPLVIS